MLHSWPEKIFRIASLLTVVFPLLLLSDGMCDAAICIIAALFIVHSYIQKDWQWCREAWVQLLLLLWLYMIARGLLAEFPKEALSRALPFGRYIFFAAALGRWTLKDEHTRKRFLIVLTGTLSGCALDGLVQYGIGYDVLAHEIIRDPWGHIRLAGPFTRPILGIMLTWLAFPAMLPLLKDSRFTASAYVLILIVTIALSGERMALLLLLAGWGLAALLLRPDRRLIVLGCTGLAVLLAAIVYISPEAFQRQIETTAKTLTHWKESPYGMLLQSDLTLAAQHPILGAGTSHFRINCNRLYAGDAERAAAMCNTHPHNIWLEWLIEEGAIGLLLFGGFVTMVLYGCWRAWSEHRANPLFIGLIVAFTLRIWPLMSATGFFSRWGAPPFWLVLGALLVYTARKEARNAGSSLPFQVTGL